MFHALLLQNHNIADHGLPARKANILVNKIPT